MATSFKSQIESVVNSEKSYATKKRELVKLGLRPNEITFVLGNCPRPEISRFSYTFGCEIEMNNLDRDGATRMAAERGARFEYQGYNHRDLYGIYKFVTDSSIQRDNSTQEPIECVSPILSGSKPGFDSLKVACEIINANNAMVNKSTGFHVHIGVTDMTNEWYANVFKNYQKIEALVDTFLAPSRRGNASRWCHSLSRFDFSRCESFDDIYTVMNGDRYHKVNPCSWGRHRTIEFRAHQGTTNFEKMKNWITFCAKLVGWSKDHTFDSVVSDIESVPFLTKTEKKYFANRAVSLAA